MDLKKLFSDRIFCSTSEMTETEWLKARKNGLGGSDIAVAAGVSPFSGMYELWLDRTNRQEKEFDNAAMERMDAGKRLESVIRQWFQDKFPCLKIHEAEFIFQHPITKWALCNIDGLIFDKDKNEYGILECKNVGEWAYTRGDWDINEVPFYYMCQLQHMLYVLDLNWGYFAYLVGGNKFSYQYVERDDELISNLEAAAGKFWNLVETDTEPAQDHLSGNALSRMYPAIESSEIDLSLDIEKVINLKEKISILKAAEIEVETAKNEIKRLMENAEIGLIKGKKIVSWKDQKTTRIDVKKIRLEQPELAAKYSYETKARVFRPNLKGI